MPYSKAVLPPFTHLYTTLPLFLFKRNMVTYD